MNPSSTTDTHHALHDRLDAVDQAHLLNFWSDLDESRQRQLAGQIASIDWDCVPGWVSDYVLTKPEFELPEVIEPPICYPRSGPRSQEFRANGQQLIYAGRIAAFCVAGGQGTRLGFDGPKGTYPATPVTGKSLFQLFAEQIVASQKRFDVAIPFYVMTSPLNHEPTVEYFRANNYFGLEPDDVMFFMQGVMPSFDSDTGKILLAAPDCIALNPDGHGGSLKALVKSGAIDDMKSRGIEHISYIQVDNPHVRVIDPLFIGLHATADDSSAQMSSKMLPKTGPFEKLGNFCRIHGHTSVIEYSDLPEDLAVQRDENGNLRFGAGSIAIHCIGVEFVQSLNDPTRGFALPLHRAHKKVPCIDPTTGAAIDPAQPNAIKLEAFVFDALPLCESSIILETDRVEEFAPIKNLTGVDSAQSSRELQIERAARWLHENGIHIPRHDDGTVNATIEISPLTALEAADLKNHPALPEKIPPGATVVL